MGVLTDTKSLTDMLTPPDPQHKKCFAHRTCRYPIEYRDKGEHTMHWGVRHMGRHPLPLKVVSNIWAPTSPYHMQTPPRT